MAEFRVGCKEKHAVHERIVAIGCTNIAAGSTHRFLEDEVINRIEAKTDMFHVQDSKGNRATVKVEERGDRKFLITERDGVKTDNLLFLPECPAVRVVTPSGSHCVRN
jgi:hypothetical protein